jgi:hypothetical protein
MHANSLKIMDKLLRKYSKQCKTVLDIGAAGSWPTEVTIRFLINNTRKK